MFPAVSAFVDAVVFFDIDFRAVIAAIMCLCHPGTVIPVIELLGIDPIIMRKF